MFFHNALEYEARKRRPFAPPQVNLKDIRASVPKHLTEKSTLKGLFYVARDVGFSIAFFRLALSIHQLVASVSRYGSVVESLVTVSSWLLYWWWQSIAWAGIWCLGHEAGHGTLSPHNWVNNALGYALHTFLLIPYYAWRATHHAHHKAAGMLEREENFVPRTRAELSIPDENNITPLQYREIFEETPIYTLGRMVLMQLLGWQFYLMFNVLGSPMYPPGTNHFSPSSPLFKKSERNLIIASNIGLGLMASVIAYWIKTYGLLTVVKFYIIPYLLANHWIVMLTFLHHTDPTLPHYRATEWNWLRGALTTVDRPLLGWIGRFFLHNVSHDHIAHHLFNNVPFYNQPKVTEILRDVLKDEYNYDSTNTFYALYRSFTECQFIENEGDIVFYKDKEGKAKRSVASIGSQTLATS